MNGKTTTVPFVSPSDGRSHRLKPGDLVYLCRTRVAYHEKPGKTVYIFETDELRRKFISGASIKDTALGYIPSAEEFPIDRINRAWLASATSIRHPGYSPDSPRDLSSTDKEPIMTKPTTIASAACALSTHNIGAAKSAAVLEAGRIANNQISKLAAKKLPMMVRGYADTPLGRLVIANLGSLAVQQLRPDDTRLQALTRAMTVQAYQELIQQVDLEGMLDDLLETKEVKRAMTKLGSTSDE